ncbi:MAG: DNA-directed RNA polymerase subunit alpha [Elusimicrobiota bacterium]|jgi:DNA-directed RNA polymerase subunit alpha|nr:DNA-directed RNA polymerase subunit alpha [Elusimicrobiota bacterium]
MLDLQKLRKLNLDEKTATEFYGRFTAEPFERGYGHTIGNSLRRILLSSLAGAAITSVKINGALHEFAVLKGVKEDVAHIILNLKKLRFKLHSDTSEKLYLKVKKGGQITASDIEKNSSIEIMNPEQEIANLDSSASLEMEMEVSSGTGYVLADEFKSSKYSVGTILLDVLFSPITKVNYEVENTRVEQTLNYDKLIIEIWTDGSISPSDALKESAKILKSSLNIFTGEEIQEEEIETIVEANGESQEEQSGQSKKEQDGDSDILSGDISVLSLSARAAKALENAEIKTVADLVKLSVEDLEGFENLGKRSIDEIRKKLDKKGLSLTGEE